jgi:tripartite-type tricarboxylate transporter receptor subunit TctC
MKLRRRQFLHLAAGAAALPAGARIARAQAYPSRPVRVIVPFAVGGNVDLIARMMGELLSQRLGQPFIIENRPAPALISAPRQSRVHPRTALRFF